MTDLNRKGIHSNEEIRLYVLKRDGQKCQWPGCNSADKIDVLFLVETDNTENEKVPVYSNGITLCQNHMDIVNLHNKAFGPMIYDLIQLVEFEKDLQATEKMYKDILK